MNNPKVLAIVGNHSGCEMYRIYLPFLSLKGEGYQVGWITKDDIQDKYLDWADVIVLARLNFAEPSERENWFNTARILKKTIIYEMDDDLFHIDPTNPAYSTIKVEITKGMLDLVDMVSVPNETLARVVREHTKKVAVLPTGIDPSMWSFVKDLPEREGLTIGVHGGVSHLEDWRILGDVLPVVAEKHPEVKFMVAGFHPDYFEGLHNLIKVPWQRIEQYALTVAQIDIGLCPLRNTVFNKSKSPIKWFEHAMCSAPCVVSPTMYGKFVEHGKTGLVARTPDEWIRCICELISNEKLRRAVGKRARGQVCQKFDIRQLATGWMETYREAWQNGITARSLILATGVAID